MIKQGFTDKDGSVLFCLEMAGLWRCPFGVLRHKGEFDPGVLQKDGRIELGLRYQVYLAPNVQNLVQKLFTTIRFFWNQSYIRDIDRQTLGAVSVYDPGPFPGRFITSHIFGFAQKQNGAAIRIDIWML